MRLPHPFILLLGAVFVAAAMTWILLEGRNRAIRGRTLPTVTRCTGNERPPCITRLSERGGDPFDEGGVLCLRNRQMRRDRRWPHPPANADCLLVVPNVVLRTVENDPLAPIPLILSDGCLDGSRRFNRI